MSPSQTVSRLVAIHASPPGIDSSLEIFFPFPYMGAQLTQHHFYHAPGLCQSWATQRHSISPESLCCSEMGTEEEETSAVRQTRVSPDEEHLIQAQGLRKGSSGRVTGNELVRGSGLGRVVWRVIRTLEAQEAAWAVA